MHIAPGIVHFYQSGNAFVNLFSLAGFNIENDSPHRMIISLMVGQKARVLGHRHEFRYPGTLRTSGANGGQRDLHPI